MSKNSSYTCFYPFENCDGDWKLQTDEPALIAKMQHRTHQKGSPWSVVGRGDIWMFSRHFANSTKAKQHLERTLMRMDERSFDLKPLKDWKGWEVCRPSDENKIDSTHTKPQKIRPLLRDVSPIEDATKGRDG